MHDPSPRSTEPDDQTLSGRVARSFLFVGAGNMLSRGLSAVALLVVLKQISREEMGHFGTVGTLAEMLQALTELSLGAAIIQSRKITAAQLQSLFWFGIAMALAAYVALFAAAPAIGEFFAAEAIAPLLRVLGLNLLLSALYQVPKSLLSRELRFGRITVVENIATALGAVTMIVLAIQGRGAWALVVGALVHHVALAILFLVMRPYLPGFSLDLAGAAGLLRFGLYATGSRLLYRFYVQADYLVVAKLFGHDILGIYYVAYRVIAEPVQTLAHVVNQVAYAAFARLQEETERLRRYYGTIIRGTLTLSGTALVIVTLFIDEALVVLGYDTWLPAIPFVHVFALFGLVRCVTPLIGQLLNARGRARQSFVASAIGAVVMPVAFVVGAQWGAIGVAWAWAIAYPLFSLVLFYFGASALEETIPRFILRSFAGLVSLVPVFITALVANLLLGGAGEVVRLAAGVALTVVVAVAVVFLREREALALARR